MNNLQNLSIILWDGQLFTLEDNCNNNFQAVNDLNSCYNDKVALMPMLSEHSCNLATLNEDLLNRNFRNELLANSKQLNQVLLALAEELSDTFNDDQEFNLLNMPDVLYFDVVGINSYWSSVQNCFNYIKNKLLTI